MNEIVNPEHNGESPFDAIRRTRPDGSHPEAVPGEVAVILRELAVSDGVPSARSLATIEQAVEHLWRHYPVSVQETTAAELTHNNGFLTEPWALYRHAEVILP